MSDLPEETLAKSDRLPVFRPTETKPAVIVAAVASADAVHPLLLDDPPNIVPLHWHEGSPFPAAKRKIARRSIGKKRGTAIASNARASGL
jgi:hypothetical protein